MKSWETDAEALLSSGARHILLLSRSNSARGQMAEAIARALAPPRVRISSAGVRRASVDPLAARVLAELSVDIADQRSKAIEDVPLDDVQAVVTLCDDVPVPPQLAGRLHVSWPLPDPAAGKGSDEERLAAYRSVRNELRRRFLVAFARGAGGSAASGAAATTFEPAAGGDFEAIRAILAASLLPSREIGLANQRFVVARQGGRIIGCAGLELYGANGQVRSLAVDWTRRNAGLGTRLHARLLDVALAAGVRTVYVVTATAQEFFSRHGYARVAVDAVPRELRSSEEFRSFAHGDAVAMSRAVIDGQRL